MVQYSTTRTENEEKQRKRTKKKKKRFNMLLIATDTILTECKVSRVPAFISPRVAILSF